MTKRFIHLSLALLLSGCGVGGKVSPEGSAVQAINDLQERPSNKTCSAFARPQDNTSVKLQRWFGDVSLPMLIAVTHAPGTRMRYGVQKTGQITVWEKDDTSDKKVFLDTSSIINARPGEAGLLGMVWHPTRKGEFYLSYTVPSRESPANLRSVIARFKTNDFWKAKLEPEILLTAEQPYENHNGGNIAFGKDGHLYISFGDGGAGGDPQNRAQNLNTLLGKMLRIDVNGAKPYAIPQDNPFVNTPNAKPEIFAYGLRNTWRFSFDRLTGDLWAGDVGQDKFEEIDIIKKGGNYGWNIKEGLSCFRPSDCAALTKNLVDPVAQYGRDLGASITGGFVYRGDAIPSLRGIYVFADFMSGNIMGLFPNEDGVLKVKKILSPGINISSFYEGLTGELHVLEFGKGAIHKLLPDTGATAPAKAPLKLSETGCFDVTKKEATAGVIPYDLNSPLWSDAAAKRRWFALPDGKKIELNDNGHFDFPTGTVLLKEFALENKIIETRLFIRHDDGVWAGYSYAWNDEGTDAEFMPNGLAKTFGTTNWQYPSQANCLQCHSSAAGFSLGLEVGQLNRDGQLEDLAKLGFFNKELPAHKLAIPAPKTAKAADAARAYMHANCSFCHRPGGSGGGGLDLRYTADLKAMGVCDKVPGADALGIEGGRLVVPGKPEKSVLLARIARRGAAQMPPLATQIVDTDATNWVSAWIKGIGACP